MKKNTYYDLNFVDFKKIGNEDNNIQWLSPTLTYSKISYEIYETFKKFLTNPYDKLYQTNLKISLSQILIIAERISKILIDIEQSLKHNIIIEYDKQNNLLLEVLLNNKNSIINSEELFQRFKFIHNYQFKNKRSSIDNIKYILFMMKLNLTKPQEKYDIQNTSNLLNDFVFKNNIKAKLIRPEQWKWPITDKKNLILQDIVEKLVISLKTILLNYLTNSIVLENGLSYFKTLIFDLLSSNLENIIFLEDLNFSKYMGKTFLGSTPKVLGRILNYYYRIHNKKIIRFSHGGDRLFFNDPQWKYSELIFVDDYYCHSTLETRLQNKKYVAGSKNKEIHKIKFKTIGSDYHKSISKLNSSKRKINAHKKILIIPGSFLGENLATHGNFKLPDIITLDLIIYTYRILIKNGFDVHIKPHPKGIYKKIFSKFLNDKNIFTRNFIFENDFDCYIFEFAGSAFYDSLFTNKGLVLLDTNIRKWYEPARLVLTERCKVVKTFSIRSNWLRFVETKFIEAVNEASEFKNLNENFARCLVN